MKTIYYILLLMTIGVGTAQAQLASDSPAPAAPAKASLVNTQSNTPLASETKLVDTLSAKNKQVRVQAKARKLPSEAEAPRKVTKPKN